MEIRPGTDGTRDTLRIMRAVTREWRVHPGIRDLAKQITQRCRSNNAKCEIFRLHAWVRDRIKYVRDVNGVETIQAPDVTLRDRSGDCDDQSVLLSALLQSIGRPSRFVAVGLRPGTFQHVYTETPLGPNWIALETTKPWPPGKRPKGAARMVQKV